ncbi:MAG: hypothetical protein M3Y08_19005 [Fibrobacterota bacterium]|nr:hypothetical protein [Fibrobacterota bacterium]
MNRNHLLMTMLTVLTLCFKSHCFENRIGLDIVPAVYLLSDEKALLGKLNFEKFVTDRNSVIASIGYGQYLEMEGSVKRARIGAKHYLTNRKEGIDASFSYNGNFDYKAKYEFSSHSFPLSLGYSKNVSRVNFGIEFGLGPAYYIHKTNPMSSKWIYLELLAAINIGINL